METIGERIKYLRKREGLKSEELAEKIGLKKGSISSYENDRYDPSAKTIVSICQEFSISADWLLMGKESSQKPIPVQVEQKRSNFDISPEEYDLIMKLRALDVVNQQEAVEIIERKYARLHQESLPGQKRSMNLQHGGNDEEATTRSETA
ncbi:helix-turn-helix domain-containing protein [Paenibacillus sp. M1]|uniref:Helix-turn-helix domain-containing protein n=1 Tax=Paenibacillus haidiansis TaxID=1574488 RepID=A0ABU7VQL0_9BACL